MSIVGVAGGDGEGPRSAREGTVDEGSEAAQKILWGQCRWESLVLGYAGGRLAAEVFKYGFMGISKRRKKRGALFSPRLS